MDYKHIYRYLDTNGDGTGTKEATGDYSLAAEDFYYESASGNDEIARLIVGVRDTGAFDAGEYGNGIALTNGIDVLVRDGRTAVETSLVDGLKIKTNAGWGALCYDVDVKTWGIGDEFMLVRWTFSKAGAPIRLEGTDRVIVRLNDDFSGLNSHTFMIQGVLNT